MIMSVLAKENVGQGEFGYNPRDDFSEGLCPEHIPWQGSLVD